MTQEEIRDLIDYTATCFAKALQHEMVPVVSATGVCPGAAELIADALMAGRFGARGEYGIGVQIFALANAIGTLADAVTEHGEDVERGLQAIAEAVRLRR